MLPYLTCLPTLCLNLGEIITCELDTLGLYHVIITDRKRSYTCLSFCLQGDVCLSACWDTPPSGKHPPWADTSLGTNTPLGQTPPWEDPLPSAFWDTQCPVHAVIDMALTQFNPIRGFI